MIDTKNTWQKPKDTYLPLEELIPNEWYAVTFAPSAQFHGEIDRYRLFAKNCNQIWKLLNTSMCELYLELSKQNQNYHYHGRICFFDRLSIVQFYMNCWELRNLTTINMKHIDTDDNGWEEYCHKQQDSLEDWCTFWKVPLKVVIHPTYDIRKHISKIVSFKDPIEHGVVKLNKSKIATQFRQGSGLFVTNTDSEDSDDSSSDLSNVYEGEKTKTD